MGEAVVSSAAIWLGKILTGELKYLGAVTSMVEPLKNELDTLAAFLAVAVKTRRQDDLVQTALSQGRDLAYDCEDVIETYILEVARLGYEDYAAEFCRLGSVIRWFCLLRKPLTVCRIRSNIDELNTRFSALRSRLGCYDICSRIDNNNNNDTLDTARCVYVHNREEDKPVGLNGQLNELVTRLLDPADQRVIVIYGMGGVGKSTLARELYRDPRLRVDGSFQAIGWAVASRPCQPDGVLKALMYSLISENDLETRKAIDHDIGARQGHNRLYSMLQKVKSVVIVDDIWTSEDWRKLQGAFPRGGQYGMGSRILLTTRHEQLLASELEPKQVYLCQVKGLDEADSWTLFKNTAFSDASWIDQEKAELAREMLRHCKGVPLAIVVLAKALERKETVEEWKSMRDDIFKQIKGGGSAREPYKKVYDVLQVSYDELPIHLKHCFLHLANYPEDFDIKVEKLFQLWAAEGIIVRQDSKEMEEDIAERYLKELVSRSMIEVASWDELTRSIKSCRLHDLMRDVCIDIANKEGFLKPISCQASKVLSTLDINGVNHFIKSCLPQDKRLRRLVVNVNEGEDEGREEEQIGSTILPPPPSDVSRAPNLRTLLIFTAKGEQHQPGGKGNCTRHMESIIKDYPLLRVFDCEEFPINGKLPKKVGEWIHLRYLGLARTHISELPSSIQNMMWLQTLDLRVNENVVVSLPNILWKMKELRHLYLPWYGGIDLAELNRLKDSPRRYLVKGEGGLLRLDGLNLQTIKYLELDRLHPNGLSNWRRLKTLSATCKTNKKALVPFLRYTNMKCFTLRLYFHILNEDPMILSECDVMHELELYGEPYSHLGLKTPLCLEMLPKSLVSLTIMYIWLPDDPLPVLEQLPKLVRLSLHMCYGGDSMVCCTGGFPELTNLWLDGLFNLCRWEVEQGALPKLKNLLIMNTMLTKTPDAIRRSVNVDIS